MVKLQADYKKGTLCELIADGRRLTLDLSKNVISCGRYSAPISHNERTVDITVVSDKCTLEVFADGGKFYMTCVAVADSAIKGVQLLGDALKNASLTVKK